MGGSVVAAFVIGITQSLLTLWMNPQRVAIAIFGIMIVVLIVRRAASSVGRASLSSPLSRRAALVFAALACSR